MQAILQLHNCYIHSLHKGSIIIYDQESVSYEKDCCDLLIKETEKNERKTGYLFSRFAVSFLETAPSVS